MLGFLGVDMSLCAANDGRRGVTVTTVFGYEETLFQLLLYSRLEIRQQSLCDLTVKKELKNCKIFVDSS